MSDAPSDLDRLSRIIRAGEPLVWIPTHEEEEALGLVRAAAMNEGRSLHTWSCVQGVCEGLLAGAASEEGTEAPIVGMARLGQIARGAAGSPADPNGETASPYAPGAASGAPVLVVVDLIDHLGEARVLRVFREVLSFIAQAGSTLVMIDHRSEAPAVVQRLAQKFEITLPGEEEIERIIRATVKAMHQQRPVKVDLRRSELDAMVRNLRGLTRRQARRIITDVIADDRVFDAADLPRVIAGKRRALSGSGLLEHVEAPASLDQIGGMGRLKAWLAQRENALSERAADFGLAPPRGLLLLGVQGAGKSLCAKAIATAWKRPLMRMNVGALYDRYVGESERQLREALRQAEAMAPLVLWIDEVEKGFASAASQSTDGGLSKRLFGELLTWLQEHPSAVFTVATANDIEALPPELLRKGRFDEIFFVDLPTEGARREIVKIHLKKRGRKPEGFDVDAIVRASAGYSGSEIEQGIVAALHESFSTGKELTTAMIEGALRGSPPLSVTMREKIEDLRAWARDRCVMAD